MQVSSSDESSTGSPLFISFDGSSLGFFIEKLTGAENDAPY